MSEIDRLKDLGNDLLDGVVDIVAAAGLAAYDPALLVHGEAADACDQLIVRLTQCYVGTTDQETGSVPTNAFGIVAEWEVRATRCVSVLNDEGEIDPADLQSDADALLRDGWGIYKGLLDAVAASEVLAICQQVVISALAPVGPEGGIGGWTFTVRAQL